MACHGLTWPDRKRSVESNNYNVGPPLDSVQLVQITPITMVYGTQITIVNGVYRPT